MANVMQNTYWNNNGAEQAKYAELKKAVQSGWAYSKKTEQAFHSYYRYFNDGDFPGWARGNWKLRKMGHFGWELNDAGLEMQEQRVTEAILSEYKRLTKSRK